ALSRAGEDGLSPEGRGRVEAADRRQWGGEAQLVALQRRELRGHEIGAAVRYVVYVDVGADLLKCALATHLSHRDVAVTIGDVAADAGGGDAVHAGQPERGRNHLRPVEAIEVEAGIVLTLAPRTVDRRWGRGQGGRQRDDQAGIEIAVGPSVQALADAGSE